MITFLRHPLARPPADTLAHAPNQIHTGERALALLCTLVRSSWAAHGALEPFHWPLGALAVESRRALQCMHSKPVHEDEDVSSLCLSYRQHCCRFSPYNAYPRGAIGVG